MKAAEFDLAAYETAYAECRDQGHDWGPAVTRDTPGAKQTKETLLLTRTRECRSCDTVRQEDLQVNIRLALVHKLRTRYLYLAGYHLPGQGPAYVRMACRFDAVLREYRG